MARVVGSTRALCACWLALILVVASVGCGALGPGATSKEADPTPNRAATSPRTVVPTPLERPLATATSVLEVLGGASPVMALPTPTTRPLPTVPVPTGSGPLQIPVRVRIPRLGIDAPVETLGLEADGAMEAPRKFDDVGWYGYGPIPGDAGASVLAGHVDSIRGPAVFWSLRDLRAGDRIEVDLVGGITRRFVVEGDGSYPSDQAPLSAIFSWYGPPHLNLITCGGTFDRSRRAYDQRLIIYARLDGASANPSGRAAPLALACISSSRSCP